ncbi:hypothetical protein ACFQFC_39410 [Amorphoplanes digitatis]|uniref:Uncharacterized protein n=1 Tax=Actinoplanes digitatis TaxID=1868 RepID=A0A7W7HWV1_9ACTN|nr:hypothetical protein [Actinoplanes digitatis]MBB4762241.1 hypothetical protein [Actinoplanes digitatis]BFE71028.1 hypothetical protein GCM10020092_043290 [Actinoplanes digitatis]GID92638.1 hypothetical protein Adi01nite_20500 [Actinoplanes digitatis]
MMTALTGSEGSVVWLVAVLLLLALGLAGALLAATRGAAAPMRAERHSPER